MGLYMNTSGNRKLTTFQGAHKFLGICIHEKSSTYYQEINCLLELLDSGSAIQSYTEQGSKMAYHTFHATNTGIKPLALPTA